MTQGLKPPICFSCIHLKSSHHSGGECESFPAGIPSEIWFLQGKHDVMLWDEPYTFELNPERQDQYERYLRIKEATSANS